LFNKNLKHWLSICILLFGASLGVACSGSNYKSNYIADGKAGLLESNEESILAEYIIVIEENISFDKAISIFNQYKTQIIRDLNKGRYLIGLKIDPGIEQLQKDIEGSEYIKHIQPNFSYTIQ
jgi:hypothetical protein